MHGNEQERFKKVVTKERIGNTFHTDPDSINEGRHRHRNADKEIEITSANFKPRKTNDGSGLYGEPQTALAQAPKTVGQFAHQGTPESHANLQRERVPRVEVEDAEIKSLSDKRFRNEREQRKTSESLKPKKDIINPRGQR